MSTLSSETRLRSSSSRPSIGIVSLSVIPDDPRVRRQGDALSAAGWEVVGIGLPGARSPLPAWRCLTLAEAATQDVPAKLSTAADQDKPASTSASAAPAFQSGVVGQTVFRGWQRHGRPLAVKMIRAAPASKFLESNIKLLQEKLKLLQGNIKRSIQVMRHWSMRAKSAARILRIPRTAQRAQERYWKLNDKLKMLYETARTERPKLWLANDWTSLPIVRRLAQEHGVPYAYDTHELATDEYAQNWRWRVAQRPLITAIEREGIADAVFVSCVSHGIAERLAKVHSLPCKPLVIRNSSHFEAHAFRPTGKMIKVLYHGLVSPGRGLEACIESIRQWRAEFVLTIRGPGSATYLHQLRTLAADHEVESRVTFAEPVPMVDLVQRAAEHDVGLFALPGHSLQNVYVLPNKFFEYVMAGLALCVSDLPEMTRLLQAHRLGELIEAVTPQAIAVAINRLDRRSIDTYKHNSLSAAHELSWESEGQKLLLACESAVANEALGAIKYPHASAGDN